MESFGWRKTKTEEAFSGTTMSVRCYESHPVLKLGKGKLYGGSGSRPVVQNADVYVALQSGDSCGKQSDPWEKQTVVEVFYGIRDMQAPSDVPRFRKLVTWLCNQLQKGKTVHVGCIGGHGRTGTLFSAIVAEMLEEKDAIQYVRKHYCKKAVESKEQVAFLMKHYGVSSVAPTKSYEPRKPESEELPWTRTSGFVSRPKPYTGDTHVPKVRRLDPEGLTTATKSFGPMASSRSLWKPKKK